MGYKAVVNKGVYLKSFIKNIKPSIIQLHQELVVGFLNDSYIFINNASDGEEKKTLNSFNSTVQVVNFLTGYREVMVRSRAGMYESFTLITETKTNSPQSPITERVNHWQRTWYCSSYAQPRIAWTAVLLSITIQIKMERNMGNRYLWSLIFAMILSGHIIMIWLCRMVVIRWHLRVLRCNVLHLLTQKNVISIKIIPNCKSVGKSSVNDNNWYYHLDNLKNKLFHENL